MGEARRRGSFEERKAQAIEAGRIKGSTTLRQKGRAAVNNMASLLDSIGLMALLRARGRGSSRAGRRGR